MRKAYISGKISGVENGNKDKFQKAEDILSLLGFKAINPHKVLPEKEEYTWEDYMKADIKALMDCDIIVMMDCYTDSRGAKIEMEIAQHVSIPVWHIDLEKKDIFDSLTSHLQFQH